MSTDIIYNIISSYFSLAFFPSLLVSFEVFTPFEKSFRVVTETYPPLKPLKFWNLLWTLWKLFWYSFETTYVCSKPPWETLLILFWNVRQIQADAEPHRADKDGSVCFWVAFPLSTNKSLSTAIILLSCWMVPFTPKYCPTTTYCSTTIYFFNSLYCSTASTLLYCEHILFYY